MFSNKEIDYSLFGIFLGDGYVDRNRRNQMAIKHSQQQREYIESIRNCLIENHRQVSSINTLGSGQVFMRSHITARHWNHNRAWKSTGVKYPSKYMLDRLTPLGLAWLWCDDGSFRINSSSGSRQGRLAVCSFTVKEVDKMMDSFTKNFGITGIRQTQQRGYPMMSFNSTGMRQLVDTVLPIMEYIPPSMRYKFDLQYEGRFEYSKKLMIYNESAFPEYRYSG